jgi:hypothetical protein
MRDVAAAMDACCGLVYATIPSVPAATEALDADRILDLDEAGERMLVSLVGEGAYVRIDRRDVLAEFRNVMCRDLAIGLREYPDFPLLVEGADPSGWSDEDRRACTKALVVRLARRFLGLDPEAPAEVDALAQWEECRRQACRHLQWYIARLALPANTPRGPEAPDFGVADLPLFLDTSGEPRSWREVRKALDQPEGLTLVYGHALGTAELGWLAAAGQRGHRPPPNRPPPSTLYADPFVHHLLAEHPAVHPAFDFELRARGDAEGDTGPLLASELVEGPGFRGRIGVPSLAPERPDIAVVLADGRRARILTAQALVHGVVGWVRLDTDTAASDDALDAVEQAVRAAAQRALGAIVDALPGVAEPEQRQRHVTLLLDYAARHVALQMDPHGRAHTNVTGTFVARVLSLPLFASQWGGMWTGWRLLRRFCGLLQSGAADPSAVILSELAPPIPHEQHRWIERVLTLQNVVRAPAHDVTPAPPLPAPDSRGTFDHPTLCATIEYWLKRLRPDDVDPATHVWLVQRDADMLMEGAVGALYINADHWLPAWALRTGCNDPQVLAWLLLAVYADLNAALDPILNSHEHVFQRRVLDALHAGELRVVGRVE